MGNFAFLVSSRIQSFLLLCTLCGRILFAQETQVPNSRFQLNSFPEGLAFSIFSGAYFPDDFVADYYSGAPYNRNSIGVVLASPYYAPRIEAACGVFNDSTFRLDSWSSDMSFRTTYMVGLGMQYLYPSSFGLVIQMTYARLETEGLMTFSTKPNHLSLDENQYQANIMGKEERLHLDIGIIKAIDLTKHAGWFVEGGFSLSNAHILNNDFYIGDLHIDLINRYGNKPYLPEYTAYDEQQKFLGFGGWLSSGLTYFFNIHTSVNMGLRIAAMQTSHEGYKHLGIDKTLYIRFILSNLFSWN